MRPIYIVTPFHYSHAATPHHVQLAAERDQLSAELERTRAEYDEVMASWEKALRRDGTLEADHEALRAELAETTKKLSEAEAKFKTRFEAIHMEENTDEGASAAMMPVADRSNRHLPPLVLPCLLAKADWPKVATRSIPEQNLSMKDVELVLRDFWRECAFSLSQTEADRGDVAAALRHYFVAQAGGRDDYASDYAANVIACCQTNVERSAEAKIFLAILDGSVPVTCRDHWLEKQEALRVTLRKQLTYEGPRVSPTLHDALATQGLTELDGIAEKIQPWRAAGDALEQLEQGNSPLSLIFLALIMEDAGLR